MTKDSDNVWILDGLHILPSSADGWCTLMMFYSSVFTTAFCSSGVFIVQSTQIKTDKYFRSMWLSVTRNKLIRLLNSPSLDGRTYWLWVSHGWLKSDSWIRLVIGNGSSISEAQCCFKTVSEYTIISVRPNFLVFSLSAVWLLTLYLSVAVKRFSWFPNICCSTSASPRLH